ncbi:MAG: hypothetical protein ACTHQQ_02905 [Solirubrobacteraceae bacterium]
MTTDGEIGRALASVTATLNGQRLEQFDADRVQQMVTESLGGQPLLTVDEGGGLHDEEGARIGAIRRTDSGGWIVERQNDTAEGSRSAIPSPSSEGKLGSLLTRIKHPRS